MTAGDRLGTICLTFDNMGSAADVGRGLRSRPGPDDDGPLGYPEVLAVLDEFGLRATFFLEGWNALHNRRAVGSIAERGHEIAGHGWVHEPYSASDLEAVDRAVQDTKAAFDAIDVPIRGFRVPGGKPGPHLVPLLAELGFDYVSSVEYFAEEEQGGRVPALERLAGGFPNIPWTWKAIDYYHYYMDPRGPRSPAEVEAYFRDLIEETARTRGFAALIFHAAVSGPDEERRSALRETLRFALEHPGIEIVTAQEAVRQWSHA